MTMQSIMQKQERCYLTDSTTGLDKHHIMNGAYRDKAEKYGLWVWLRHDVHMWLHQTPQGAKYARELKQQAQREFEKTHTRAEWLTLFHRNYL